jgi:translocation and assembly module TamB
LKRRLIYAALGLFILLATLITLVFGTTPGAHWLLRQAQQMLPGELSVAGLRGSLLAGLALEAPRYRDARVDVTAERLLLRWDAFALFTGRIRIDRMQADDLHVDVADADASDTTPQQREMALLDLRLPLPVDLPRIDVEALRLSVDGRAYGLDRLHAALHAEHSGIDLRTFEATAGDARIAAEGRLAWADRITWQSNWHASALDPSHWLDDLPGRIDAELNIDGAYDGSPVVTLDLVRAEGLLRGRALSAGGRIALADGGWSFTDVNARLGDNHLHVDGRIDTHYALRAQIDAPALDAFWPGLGGTLRGEASLDGERDAPLLTLTADGQTLVFGDERIDALRLRADIEVDGTARVDLRLEDAHLGGIDVPHIAVEGGGTPNAHRLRLTTTTADASGAVELDGGWHDGAWQGRLQRLELRTAEAGDWRLAHAAALAWSATSVRLESSCLVRERASLCLEAHWMAGDGGHVEARLQDLPLALFDEPIQARVPGLRLRGTVQGAWRLDDDGTDWRGEAQLEVGRGALHHAVDELRSLRLPFDAARFEARLDAGHWQAAARVDLRAGGMLHADIAGTPQDAAPTALAGKFTLEMTDFEWLTRFNPWLAEPRGRLHADYRIGGDVAAPALEGVIRLEQAALTIPELGLSIEDIGLTLTQPALDRVQMSGSLRSGAGALEFGGDAARMDYGWHAALRAEGKDLQAIDLPFARVQIDPLVAVSLSGRDLTVSGRLHVPTADVELRMPAQQAVRVSEDEVLVGVVQVEAERWNVRAALELGFGDHVHIRGYGLSGRLAGALLLSDGPEDVALGDGELRVEDGRFQAYGQNLTVERGRLLFHGPVDNPGLDIRAARTAVDGVKAGIEIAGTLRQPRSRAYSEPALPESEAMAWLLTGRPLSGASGEEVLVMQQAAVLFGMERGSMLVSELAAPLGFEEATIDTSRGLDQSALLLGRYLTPRLYLRYTLGLAEGESALLLRYRLSKSWNLEAQTGTSQSLDLLYRIER